jgi:hypothetical protein
MISSKLWRTLIVAILIAMLGTVGAWGQPASGSTKSTADYFLMEFLFGLQGALIGGGLGYYGTYLTLTAARPCPTDQPEQACEIEKSFIALTIGTNIGIPTGAALLGVSLAGVLLHVEGGNLWLALAGAWIGSLAGATLGSNWALQPSDLTLLINPVTMAAVGATIGYNVGTTLPSTLPSIQLDFIQLQWRF